MVRPDAFRKACPSHALFARMANKWSLLALVALERGPLRFGVLRRSIDGVSQKMLSQTLRHLERDGLVIRRAFDERPVRVEYALSDAGCELLPVVKRLKRWAETHFEEVARANRRDDAAATRTTELRR